MMPLGEKLAHFSIINSADWFTFQLSLMPMAQTGSLFNYQQRCWLTFQLSLMSMAKAGPLFNWKMVPFSFLLSPASKRSW